MPLPESRFQKDFLDMLSALLDAGVEFLMVGGHAVARHGHPRATKDMDLWVRPTPENAKRLWSALRAFGAPLHDISESDFTTEDLIFQIGLPPHRIDLITSIAGVLFEVAWSRRVEADVEGLRIPVIGRDDLIANKKSTGRKQDEADVEALEKQVLSRRPSKSRRK